MMEDLQKAYAAYQQAVLNLPNHKDPNLWYGIGILYDRFGSYDHAEAAFKGVLSMEPNFEKKNEIHFRLGLINKQQVKYEESLEWFKSILRDPPKPLVRGDIYFQIGNVYEQMKEFSKAKEAYEIILKENSGHAKVLQHLGWLYHQQVDSDIGLGNQEVAISYLMRSIDSDPSDGQTWYLLGRCYMAQKNYRKAYDAYQQAVYRDGHNPAFWCSIGVLYFQINQYRDSLDAYSRAIRINPYSSEVWYDLGRLYDACNQKADALDAYHRAKEIDMNKMFQQQRGNMPVHQDDMMKEREMPMPTVKKSHPENPLPPNKVEGSTPQVLAELKEMPNKQTDYTSTSLLEPKLDTKEAKEMDESNKLAPLIFSFSEDKQFSNVLPSKPLDTIEDKDNQLPPLSTLKRGEDKRKDQSVNSDEDSDDYMSISDDELDGLPSKKRKR